MRHLVCLVAGILAVSCGKAAVHPTESSSNLASFNSQLAPNQIEVGGKFLSCGETMIQRDSQPMFVVALQDPGKIFRDEGGEELGIGWTNRPPNAAGICDYTHSNIKVQDGKWYWWHLNDMKFQKTDGTILTLSTNNCRTRFKQGDEKVQHLIIGGQDRYDAVVAVQVVDKKVTATVCAPGVGEPIASLEPVDVDVEIKVIP